LIFFFPFPHPKWVFYWEFFFPHPPCPPTHSPTYLHLNYLSMHHGMAFSLPHLPTHPHIYLLLYLCTKSSTRWWWHKLMKVLQYTTCRLLHHPSYPPTKPCNFVTIENNVVMP
jgi:hypothetical protein